MAFVSERKPFSCLLIVTRAAGTRGDICRISIHPNAFSTSSCAGSLPEHVAADASPAEIDRLLDERDDGALFADQPIAAIVEAALLHFDGRRYRLLGWCVMPNHVHVVVQQMAGFRLGDVVASWKGYTAREINRRLGRVGSVWARDYFDRYVRDEAQMVELLNYIENNPVVVGLVDNTRDWNFSSARWRRA